jgi:TetR/AcrR family hemagglutinin/protease transcriptional regulator
LKFIVLIGMTQAMTQASSNSTPRKRLSPDARRAQLLDTAIDVFAEMGLERAGHGDIAKRAGVSTPTVFNYFPTRDALLQAVLVQMDVFVDDMFKHVPKHADDRRHRILQLAGAFQRMVAEQPNAAKTLLKWGVSFDPDIRPAYLNFQNRMLDRMVAILPDNPADPAKARAEARILYGASNLFAAMAFDNFRPEEMIDFVGRIADVLSHSS